MANEGYYLIGSTVRLRAKVTRTDTRAPADGTVELVRLSLNGEPVALDTTIFTQVTDGEFLLVIPTATLSPGSYKYLVRVSNGPDEVTLAEGTFVLRLAAA